MTDKTGGPAFPGAVTVGPSGDVYTSFNTHGEGLTIRDYMAAHAMTGLLSHSDMSLRKLFDEDNNHALGLSGLSYKIADAMLRARGEE